MDSEVPSAPSLDKDNTTVDKSPKRTGEIKKQQVKVPKRIHKAEREKMKRKHLNELFLALANAPALTDQNSGKATILGEATRTVKDTLAQIEYLKRENAALLSESQYVTTEKNELKDENSALEIQIGKLQSELKDQMTRTKLDLNVAPPESQQPELVSKDSLGLPAAEPPLQQAPTVNHPYVNPFSNFRVFAESRAAKFSSKLIPNVSRPHPRYPSPADSWPSQLLEKHSELGKEEFLQINSQKQRLA